MDRPHTPDPDRNAAARQGLSHTQALRLIALALLLIGCFVVLRPFLSALMWSVILVISVWPVYSRLVIVVRGRRTLAAAIMTAITLVVLLVPFVVIGIGLADDVARFAVGARHVLTSPGPEPPAWVERLPLVGGRARPMWEAVASDSERLMSYLRRFIEPVSKWLLGVSVGFASGLTHLALSILIAFFLFRDGPDASRRFVDATQQLAGEEANPLIALAVDTIRGVVYGILGTALAQSVLAGIGLAVAGVPGAALLALATFFLSIVPMGPPLIWVPATTWLFAHGSTGWGIFLACWGILLISGVDNVIKPLIIGQGSRMPFVLVLLGVMGGAIAFGFIGVFLGPTLLAVGFRLLSQWSKTRAAR